MPGMYPVTQYSSKTAKLLPMPGKQATSGKQPNEEI